MGVVFDVPEVAYYPLLIPQGLYVSRFLGLTQGDGSLRDTAGYRAEAVVVADYGLPVLLELSTTTKLDGSPGNGRITMGIQGTAPDQFNVQFDITEADSNGLTLTGIGFWQMDIKDTAGRRFVRVEGPCALDRRVVP